MIFRAKAHQAVADALRVLPVANDAVGSDGVHQRLDALAEQIAQVREQIAQIRERVARLEVVILIVAPLVTAAFQFALVHLLK